MQNTPILQLNLLIDHVHILYQHRFILFTVEITLFLGDVTKYRGGRKRLILNCIHYHLIYISVLVCFEVNKF